MNEEHKKSILQMARGAIQERADYEMSRSFTEADGGMWKLKARETVKAFLEDKLSDLIADGAVVVAL